MQQSNPRISSIEKIISILSYFTMGMVGLIWLIIAHILKRKLRYFLMYNISQSMVIAIILAIFKLFFDIILPLFALIPALDFIAAKLHLLLSFKILTISSLGLTFTIVQLLVFILLIYITAGILLNRIFYIPYLTDFMQKVMKSYEQ
ncbi:MAG: hypothetical protein LUG16_06275 [Candidatus Gastranaerophilales bacterium]|nr:hypothetical protein [Candidatus Gastranaerophilales bacterium]